MEVIPFKRVGDFDFSSNYMDVKRTLKEYEIIEDVIEIGEKKYPRIYVKKLDLMVNFQEDLNSVRFFEFFKDSHIVVFKGKNLMSAGYESIEKEIAKNDPELNIEESGLESEKFGITISRLLDDDNEYSNNIDSILVGSKSYVSEQEIDLNELYKSFMGVDLPDEIDW